MAFFPWIYVIAAILSLILVILLIYRLKKSSTLPPGPAGLPLVGYLPFLGKRLEVSLVKLQKKYGNIVSFYMGNQFTLTLNNFESIDTAFNKTNDFNDRPKTIPLKILPEDTGLITTSGEIWKTLRRHAIRTFRDIGIDKTNFESHIQEGIQYFLGAIEESHKEPINPYVPLRVSIGNTMLYILCGKKFKYDDPSMKKIVMLIDEYPVHIAHTALRSIMPWTRFIPVLNDITAFYQIKSLKDTVTNFFQRFIDEKKANHNYSRSDYIGSFLKDGNAEKKKANNPNFFGENVLHDNILELLTAGINTLDLSLRYTFLLLMLHPEVQEKLQQEIDEVIGTDRLPTIADRTRMPYTEAVIMEVQRYGSIIPNNAIHANPHKTTLSGFEIPANATVISNLWAVHNDPNLWENPELFKPERFIIDGKFEKPPYLIPFSTGKRKCLGENFAKVELFLYVTTIYQKVTITFPDNERVSAEPVVHGIANSPKQYKMCAKSRQL